MPIRHSIVRLLAALALGSFALEAAGQPAQPPRPRRQPLVIPDVARDQLICFCLYTTHNGILKLTAQLYPLRDDEARQVVLEVETDGRWQAVATAKVNPEGWMATFRVEGWDDSQTRRYRVVHAGGSNYGGIIRRNPLDKDEIIVANLSCNSNTHRGPRQDIVDNLKAQDPDLLFFGGDQVYDHTEHTAAWLLFGRQFGDIIRDRPTVTIPDDHDVGHPNVWGAGGKVSKHPHGPDGGYIMPPEYVNMVQRAQTAHLPDPYDPTPVLQGITVYYTALNIGGIDFAILEDRKWKTGPLGLVPEMGPRPDHITDPTYDPAAIDVPEAELLGERQLTFLRHWAADWGGAQMKCVLSQSPFAGAAHLHGRERDRLIADLDSNGWPQSGRNAALREIRKAFAFMMSGDQHLATVIHHGINEFGDSGWQFTSPSIWNLYGRVWAPLAPAAAPFPGSTLPLTGRFLDGFGNKVTMAAYANPTDENHQGAGYGLVRFNKANRTITMECWPRFVDVTSGQAQQYEGWPLTIHQQDNYARRAIGWLPQLIVTGATDTVVQVIDEFNGEVVYTLRIQGTRFQPKVFRAGTYTVRIGEPGRMKDLHGIPSTDVPESGTIRVDL
jgi:hypothetical protein